MKISPKDFFLHIAVIVTLYISAGSFLALVFEIINYLHPDALSYIDPYSTGMRLAIAALVILFPLFLLLSWLINNDLEKSPEKREMGIRKWLTYLTLFIAGGIVVGDLVTLINTFLGGEITTRFTLKVISVLIVAGVIFWYYLMDLKNKLSRSKARIFGGVVAVVVVVTLVGGFLVMGSPTTQRNMRFDEQKIMDLQNIQWQIGNYFRAKGTVPTSLDQLNDPISGFSSPVDSQTNKPYEYKKVGNTKFEICAEFNLPSSSNRNTTQITKPMGVQEDNWQHEAGRACFERTIDPQLYPIKQTV